MYCIICQTLLIKLVSQYSSICLILVTGYSHVACYCRSLVTHPLLPRKYSEKMSLVSSKIISGSLVLYICILIITQNKETCFANGESANLVFIWPICLFLLWPKLSYTGWWQYTNSCQRCLLVSRLYRLWYGTHFVPKILQLFPYFWIPL